MSSMRLLGPLLALALIAPAAAAGAPATDARATASGGLTASHGLNDITAVASLASNTRFLTPRAGIRLSTLRPTLRWRGVPGGTTRVNVQIFRIDRRGVTTVLSVFTPGRAYRVPTGRLAPGELYVWRVWAQRGSKGYTPTPIGVSFFSVATDAD